MHWWVYGTVGSYETLKLVRVWLALNNTGTTKPILLADGAITITQCGTHEDDGTIFAPFSGCLEKCFGKNVKISRLVLGLVTGLFAKTPSSACQPDFQPGADLSLYP